MTAQLTLSTGDLQFAGGNRVDVAATVPTTGSYTAGDLVIQNTTTGEVSGWKRLTTGAAHVLGTDWLAFGALGTAQTWQTFTLGSTRIHGTTYYNTTSRPIVLSLTGAQNATSQEGRIIVNGVTHSSGSSPTAGTWVSVAGIIVPVGGSYYTSQSGGTWSPTEWKELR